MGNHTVAAEPEIPSLLSVMQAWITRAKNKADARARQAAREVPPPPPAGEGGGELAVARAALPARAPPWRG